MVPLEREISKTDAEKAAHLLEITEDVDTVTVETVKERYRQVLLSTHPDRNPNISPTDASTFIIRAKRARQLLETWIALRPKADCNVCGGSGRIRNGTFSTRPCPKCG